MSGCKRVERIGIDLRILVGNGLVGSDSGPNPDGPIQAFSIRNRLLALTTEAIHLSSLAHQCGRPQMVSEMLVALSDILKGGDV